MNPLKALSGLGQSPWLDFMRRKLIGPELDRMIEEDGLGGMTSNPAIFEKAIGHGSDYDAQLSSLIGKETDPGALFEALAIQDIRSACDEFRALFDETHGADGYVSLEVSPTLAHDTQGTIDAAARLWKAVDRPNVMIKIPGTPAGVPAIRARRPSCPTRVRSSASSMPKDSARSMSGASRLVPASLRRWWPTRRCRCMASS